MPDEIIEIKQILKHGDILIKDNLSNEYQIVNNRLEECNCSDFLFMASSGKAEYGFYCRHLYWFTRKKYNSYTADEYDIKKTLLKIIEEHNKLNILDIFERLTDAEIGFVLKIVEKMKKYGEVFQEKSILEVI